MERLKILSSLYRDASLKTPFPISPSCPFSSTRPAATSSVVSSRPYLYYTSNSRTEH